MNTSIGVVFLTAVSIICCRPGEKKLNETQAIIIDTYCEPVLFGDGWYTTIKCYDGKVIAVKGRLGKPGDIVTR